MDHLNSFVLTLHLRAFYWMSNLREHLFESGFKISYFFSLAESFDTDSLEELKNFTLAGPLSLEINEKSPLYQESLTSRALLLEALKYYKSKKVGGVAFSLSHTRGAALVGAAASLKFEGAKLAAGIGADLESVERKISEAAHKRIVNGGMDSQVPALNLWSLKEAAYKAHPDNENLLLRDFIVTGIKDKAHFKLLCSQSQKTFEASIIHIESYVVALARLI